MKKNIDIKSPCTEDFSKMTSTDKGSFCDKCEKDVYDFSDKSTTEIRDVLKLNLGGSVCGRLKPSQIEALNEDYSAWRIDSKRTFQSALLFSLIVAFGMTLFGCEEDEQAEKINEIQSIGMTFMQSGAAEAGSSLNAEINKLDEQEVNLIEMIKEPRMLVGEMVIEENHEVSKESDVLHETRTEIMVDGGIGYSPNYTRYLEEVPFAERTIKDHILIREKIEFQAFAFPNPAQSRTTLKVVLPKATKVQIQLFGITGQFIKSISTKELPKGESNLPIDLIDLPIGTYIVSIISNDYKESVKFIKR